MARNLQISFVRTDSYDRSIDTRLFHKETLSFTQSSCGKQAIMSYDLTLLQVPPSSTIQSAYQQWAEREEAAALRHDDPHQYLLPENTRQTLQHIADSLKTNCPSFEQFHPRSPLPWLELNEEDHNVQVMISADSVTIHLPYFDNAPQEMLRITSVCLDILTTQFGFTAFDPQLARTVTAADFADITRAYQSVPSPAKLLLQMNKTNRKPKPWWKIW